MSPERHPRCPAGKAPLTGKAPLEAVLLVGGKGTRLRPLTVSVPKPLLPAAGVPFLVHQLAWAAAAHVTRVVLATAYRAETFAEALGDGSAFGIELDYVHEPEPLGTGGAIRNAAASLRSGSDDPVVVLNGDVLSGHDLQSQLDLHAKTGAAVTLHLVEMSDPARYGCVPTDADGRVTAFLEKTARPVSDQVNAGCYVFSRRYIDRIPADQVVSVERDTFPSLIAAGELIVGYKESAYFLDVGTPESFVRGCRDLVLGNLRSSVLPGAPAEALVLPGAQVHPSARLSGGTVIGARSVIGPGAELQGAVLFDDVCVAERATISASVIGRGACIGAGAVLQNVVVGDRADVGARNELRSGMRVWSGIKLEPCAVRFSADDS
jgi:mannose-1-phosphate guanylyltransferase